jgi:hypothetical protein
MRSRLVQRLGSDDDVIDLRAALICGQRPGRAKTSSGYAASWGEKSIRVFHFQLQSFHELPVRKIESQLLEKT